MIRKGLREMYTYVFRAEGYIKFLISELYELRNIPTSIPLHRVEEHPNGGDVAQYLNSVVQGCVGYQNNRTAFYQDLVERLDVGVRQAAVELFDYIERLLWETLAEEARDEEAVYIAEGFDENQIRIVRMKYTLEESTSVQTAVLQTLG